MVEGTCSLFGSGKSLMSTLRADVFTCDQIDSNMQRSMYALFARYYDAVDFETFAEDLSEKDYVVLLREQDEAGEIRGFSTVSVLDFSFQQTQGRAIFSGDTIIDRDFWGEQTLPWVWCRLAGFIKSQAPEVPLYWMLIVKGHRTYRLMTLFSKEHYPTWKASTPDNTQALMNFLGALKFGESYDTRTGLIRFQKSRGQLKPEVGDVREGYREKPDVKFFCEKNPNYLQGDELLCLTELKTENMRATARRGFLEPISLQ